jgi:hypothetical protein
LLVEFELGQLFNWKDYLVKRERQLIVKFGAFREIA